MIFQIPAEKVCLRRQKIHFRQCLAVVLYKNLFFNEKIIFGLYLNPYLEFRLYLNPYLEFRLYLDFIQTLIQSLDFIQILFRPLFRVLTLFRLYLDFIQTLIQRLHPLYIYLKKEIITDVQFQFRLKKTPTYRKQEHAKLVLF